MTSTQPVQPHKHRKPRPAPLFKVHPAQRIETLLQRFKRNNWFVEDQTTVDNLVKIATTR